MERPVVALDNYEAVYDFYLEHRQSRPVARAAYALLAARYRPRVCCDDGVRDRLRELIRARTPLLVVANHLTHSDQYVLAATAWRSPLRPVIGSTRVLAKDELFADESQRRKIDMMGGIPVFRAKNHGLRAVSDAGRRMMDVSAARLHHGDSVAIFPEGTCNEGDPTRLQPLGTGIGHIVRRSRDLGARPALVCVGIGYGPGKDPSRPASVFLTEPVTDLDGKVRDVTRLVQDELQRAVDGAVARY
ncbi:MULTISPECIES: 1-acyl-sn-glycerol-3-phosphate acyltransferase [Rhodococcus]|uniref:lysophospholipid acyltransferase family protein n=1 Tax=Rhodococcus TaxID=1827 RepID=UPI00163AB6AE|nr:MULTISPECIES: 1-acyl-sn-glycerol-3-phosphate acyltransferase [Rhodococcus]MBC2588695.1 1-acyl-sn-glycerol-3-phosphate acyltransferase [Rhodococcus aetherivorans]QRI78291.1 1-acyl-sn-glycerol-3-phosphate acyltransferase [Rhodococcus aetherivorans]QSE61704.1 1-acyl-sn-glycerol-3-phosphate acyltransferase [Rhodococcus sp. PSBB066]QSE66987.1 1-acyl-sn-glycerol-3-phosphate acyltransferase [Rhodococcus sp. PSBB049]